MMYQWIYYPLAAEISDSDSDESTSEESELSTSTSSDEGFITESDDGIDWPSERFTSNDESEEDDERYPPYPEEEEEDQVVPPTVKAEMSLEQEQVETEENTTFSDMRETTQETGYLSSQIQTSAQGVSMQESNWHVMNVMKKPLVVETVQWTTSQNIDTVLSSKQIPGDMLLGPHYNLTSTFMFWRGHPKVRVQVNGTKFHSGRVMAVFIPQYQATKYDAHLWATESLTSFPHVMLDASTSNSGVIDIPFVHMQTYFNTIKDSETSFLGQLTLLVFNKLGSTTTASPTIDITTWISYEDCELHQPCHAHPVSFVKSKRSYAKAESGVEGLVKSVLPTVADLVAPGASLAVGNVAGAFSNLDKPADPVEISRWVPNTVTSLNFGEGLDKSNRLSLRPGTATVTNADIISTTKDDMNLLELAKIPTRADLELWRTSHAPGSRLGVWGVHPSVCSALETTEDTNPKLSIFTPTLLAYVSRPMKYWRGSLRYKIQVIASAMQSGRIQISFAPGFWLDKFDVANYMNTYIIDLQEKSEIEVVVPYMSTRPWLRCDKLYLLSDDVNNQIGECCTGSMAIHVLNRLSCPDSTAQEVQINVFVSAGDDFELGFPSDLSFSEGIGEPVLEAPVKAEALRGQEYVTERSDEGHTTMTKGGGMLSPVSVSTLSENAMDLKTVLRRYQIVYKDNGVKVGASTKTFCMAFPNTPTLSSKHTNYGTTGVQCRTHLAHYSELFTFWRGSLRYKFIFSNDKPIKWTVFHVPGVFGPSTFDPRAATGDFEKMLPSLTSTGVQIAVSQTQNSIEFEIPFYTPYLQLRTVHAKDIDATAATGTVLIIGQVAEGTEYQYDLYQAAGDDFGLNYLRGAPKMQFVQNMEEYRTMGDKSTWLYHGMKLPDGQTGKAVAKAEMFRNFRNPITTSLDTAESVKQVCDTATGLMKSASSVLGLTARETGCSDIAEGEDDEEPDESGSLITKMLKALGTFANDLMRKIGGKVKDLVVTVSNIVSGFNSFLQASSFVVKAMAIVTVVSELFGDIIGQIKDKLFWLVSKILDGFKEGNQKPKAESLAIFSFAPIVAAVAGVGMLIGGFASIPNDDQTGKIMKQLTERMRTFNFGCAAIANIKSCYNQLKELFEWVQETCLEWLAPQLLAQMKLQKEFKDVETWTKFIDEHYSTDYIDRSNWDTEFRSKVLRSAEAGERYNNYLIQGKIGKEASIIREYVRKSNEMRDLVAKSTKALPFRKDPFCVAMFGVPGVGKSTCILDLGNQIMDDQGYPRQSRICPVNCTAKQFSEDYKNNPAVYLDDISVFTSQEQYEHFMALKANTKYALDKPFDKKDFFTSDFIFMTTNIPHPRPNFINDVDALWRRRDLLIEMDFVDEETRERAKREPVHREDMSHAVFYIVGSRDETARRSRPYTWLEIVEEAKRRARLHYVIQERVVRSLLAKAGYELPAEVTPVPPEGTTPEEVNAWFMRTFHPDEVVNAEGGDCWLTRNWSKIHFDLTKIQEDPLLSLYDERIYSNLEWSNGAFCLNDKALKDEVMVREWASMRKDFVAPYDTEEEGLEVLTKSLRDAMSYQRAQDFKCAVSEKITSLRETMKSVWEKMMAWLKEKFPYMHYLQSWPAKLALGLGALAVLVGFAPKVIHRCICYAATHLGYRCPKCGKWPELEKCKDKEWLLKEWKAVYGDTVDYVDGTVLSREREATLMELHGESFEGMMYGTEKKFKSEGGPYNDITAGGRIIKIVPHGGPYGVETRGGPSLRTVANSGQKTEDLINHRVIPCLYRLRGLHGSTPASVNGFALGDRQVLIPGHFYDAMDTEFEIFHSGAWLTVRKDEKKARRIPNKDLVLFEMPMAFHQHSSMVKHLISEKQLSKISTTNALMMRQMNTTTVTMEQLKAKMVKELHYEQDTDGDPIPYYTVGLWEYRAAAAPGACGSVLLTTNDSIEGQIIGFHCAGNGVFGYSQILTREMVEDFFPTKLGTPFPKVEARFTKVVPDGHFGRIGCLPPGQGVFQSDRSEIIPTAIQGMVSEPVTQPAILSRRDPRYKGTDDIMTKGIAKYGKAPKPFNPRHLEMIEESINAEIEQWEIPRKPEILTLEQTLSGIELLDGYDRLPMRTSPGWPYVNSRPRTEIGKAYLFDAEAKRIVDKELETRWSARLELAKRGERVQSVWTCCLKDERRPLAKIEAGSTRLFVVPPVDFSLLMRMYTLDFSMAIKMNRHTSFTKVGIDTQSLEWSQLYNYLASCSEFVVAGDFEKFDGTLTPELTHQFFKHCNYFYATHGTCTAEDIKVRGVLADESVHTVLLAREEVFLTHVGNKSGNPNTVNVNSFANYYYMALAYLGIAESLCPTQATMDKFRKNVRVAVYGDDNVLAIKREILDWYNQITIAEFLKKFGIVYTNETKTGLTKYKKLDDASFLKCRFANHESIAKVKVPLMTEATILELLNWTRKAPDQDELLESNCNDALRFAYFYGSSYFNSLRGKIIASLKQVNLHLDIMTYSDFHYWFLFVCGLLPHGKFSPEMNVLESIAASGNNSFARFINRIFVGGPCRLMQRLGWFVRSGEQERTDPRFAVAIPSGEGKSWLCKKYPHIFVDHDDLLLPAAAAALKKHGLSWSRLWEILDTELPPSDKRILLVHHPANTRRQMIGSYMLPKPNNIRANAYQRMRLGNSAIVMERDERNTELLTLAKKLAPYLFKGDPQA